MAKQFKSHDYFAFFETLIFSAFRIIFDVPSCDFAHIQIYSKVRSVFNLAIMGERIKKLRKCVFSHYSGLAACVIFKRML